MDGTTTSHAREDREGRPLTVLALARTTNGFYFGGMLAGLTRVVAERGGRVVVAQTVDPNEAPDRVVEVPRFGLPVAWDQVDGAVVISLSAGAEVLTRLRETVPVVLTHRVEGFRAPVALPDNRRSTTAVVDHLVEHGHRRIAFLGRSDQLDLRERRDAFCSAVAARGLETAPGGPLVIEPDANTHEAGARAAQAVLACEPRPTAVVVATDHTALGLLEGLEVLGVRVPQDVAVVGHDDLEIGSFASPTTLSSVSMHFDEVGALAGRLLLDALDGVPVADAVHCPEHAVVATRGSCGCTTQPLLARDPAVRLVASPPEEVRDAVLTAVGDALAHSRLSGRPVPDDDAAATLEVATRLGDGSASAADAHRLVRTFDRLVDRPDLLHPVANTVTQLVERDLVPGGHALGSALWRLQARALLRRREDVERVLDDQIRIASALLHSSTVDARALTWLGGTHVRGGVLALWDGDPADGVLRVVGAYDPQGRLGDVVGTATRVESFPPRALVDLARADLREACYVVPVRTAERQWGVLAVIGEVDPTSTQAHYSYWASLLSAAFEEEQLEQAVRASEDRYAHAARAANDGLWEFDRGTRSLFTASRFRELLGVPDDGTFDELAWLGRIHPDDAAAFHEAMAGALEGAGVPVEAELRVPDGDGCWRWLLVRGLGVAGPDGSVVRLVGSLSDIHPRKVLEEQLRRGALYDAVTGLPNRRLFVERLDAAVHRAARRPGARYAVVFMDLDGFKLVNDSLGHLVGDQLLTVVAERLSATLRTSDTAARFGGDEFAVLLVDAEPDEVLAVAARLQERIAEPVVLGRHEVSVTASAGIATSESGYVDVEDVLRDADIAMYDAKSAGRGGASVFDRRMHARAQARLQARTDVRTALVEEQFVVHYQPVVALDSAPLDRFEALVRWQHPERGLLMPGAFLPAVEESGSMVALGQWVLDEVCRQVAAWSAQGKDATVAVNVSHEEFWSPDLVATVAGSLERHGVPADQLVLEITETVVMDDAESARARMARLRELGVRLHIDDFGTGQSSLHALRSLPATTLKIDGSFICDLGLVDQTTELVRIIVEIGQVLGLSVVAECVETPQQAQFLRAMGCTFAQGWLYARAVAGPEAGAMLGRVPALVG